MSVASKHNYRFNYLKSDHWKDLRLRKLVSTDAKCEICAFRCLQNDVHHTIYRRPLTNAKLTDLVVLCRSCHQAVHELIEIAKVSHSIAKSKVFELTRRTMMQWTNGPMGKRINYFAKAQLKVKHGICCICGVPEKDAIARNVIHDHGFFRAFDYSKWAFCEPCFEEFKKAFAPSEKATLWYHALNEAKTVRKKLRQIKLLTAPVMSIT